MSIPGIRKIAVLRANALGDFLFVLPALEALRSTYPEAEIVFLGKQWHANFLRERPSPIDRVVVIPSYRGVGSPENTREDPAEIETFFRAMKNEQFDLACQLHGGGRYSTPFIKQLGARITIGLKAPEAPELDQWVPYIYFQHEILRYLEVVSLVGARTSEVEPHITVTEQDRSEIKQHLTPEDFRQPLVVLHPGASDPRRRWPIENFAAIGDILAEKGARIIVTGTESERALTQAVIRSMSAPASDLAGKISLNGLAALLRYCHLVISNDTGPLHLSNAVGTASVGIFWCFNLVTAAPLLRSRHRPITSWQRTCPVCGIDNTQGNCQHRVSFVADIPIEAVKEAALELF